MEKLDSLQGSLDLLVLKILSRRPRLHGYAIMSAVGELSGDVLRAEEGSLYPALHRMEEAGVDSREVDHKRYWTARAYQ
jgi:PadR family transcriptional regulator PadR